MKKKTVLIERLLGQFFYIYNSKSFRINIINKNFLHGKLFNLLNHPISHIYIVVLVNNHDLFSNCFLYSFKRNLLFILTKNDSILLNQRTFNDITDL